MAKKMKAAELQAEMAPIALSPADPGFVEAESAPQASSLTSSPALQAEAPIMNAISSSAISMGSVLAKLAQGIALAPEEAALFSTPEGVAALQGALKKTAVGGGGRKAPEVPAFGSISADDAAALKPSMREAYLAQAPGFALALPSIPADKAEGLAAMIARRLEAPVVLLCGGAEIMRIAPDHGQAERAPKGEREGDKPSEKQEKIIALATRGMGATGAELMEGLGLTTPHTWPPALRALERFGFSFRAAKRGGGKYDGYAQYHLDAETDAAAEMAENFKAKHFAEA